METFIARQPNGLLCRFSWETNTVTHFNMTDDEYIKMCQEKAANEASKEAREILKNHTEPFYMVRQFFLPKNMSKAEFDKILKKMERPKDEIKKMEVNHDK
jgi:hypothetical protein